MAASGELGVRVPPDLHAAPPRTLEVRALGALAGPGAAPWQPHMCMGDRLRGQGLRSSPDCPRQLPSPLPHARCWLSGPRCGSLFSHPLCPLPSPTLQEYTRARILQFAQAFAARLNPTVAPSVVQQAALDCLQALPPPDYSGVALEHRDLQLVFRHDCL